MNDSNRGVLVAGIDSSTQSATIVIKDAASGQTLRSASVPHPPGTEVDPQHWWDALEQAIEEAGGLADVSAVSVGGQQHGMVALDKDGQVIRPALLWNDTRSAAAANDLINELGDGDNETGRARWASRVGVVPVASFTITKLRWLARNEPDNAARVAAVALPHDWLSWKLASQAEGALGIDELRTDASDASGTGYFDGASGSYQQDLLELGFGRSITLPRVVDPGSAAFRIPRALRHGILGEGATGDLIIGAGAGDNAAAAFGLGLELGDVALSIGTSGVVSAVSDRPTDDPSGIVASFRDASGHFLPLACTLNGSPVFDAVRALLQVGHEEFSELALSAAPGSEGLTLVPYFAGERTPNLPDATGALHGATTTNLNRQNLARSAVEGVLSGLADALDAVREGGHDVARVFLIGGAARSHAVQELAPSILGVDVLVPQPDEYVAAGAARQAAWALAGSDQPPVWPLQGVRTVPTEGTRQVREQVSQRYEEARGKFLGQLPAGR